MTRIFMPTSEGWEIRSLESERYRLHACGSGVGPQLLPERDPEAAAPHALLLRRREAAEPADAGWALVADRRLRVFVNGEPLVVGLALLRDRDEIRVDGAEPVYLSTERLARVEACERDDAPRCPRCASPIARGELAVRCPGCGVLHHQRADRGCWSYAPKCALCDHASDLEAGLRWTPEEG